MCRLSVFFAFSDQREDLRLIHPFAVQIRFSVLHLHHFQRAEHLYRLACIGFVGAAFLSVGAVVHQFITEKLQGFNLKSTIRR